jgi:membrane fusion protein, multidrug efflux system
LPIPRFTLFVCLLGASGLALAQDPPPRPVAVKTVQKAPLVQTVEVRGSVAAPRTARLSTAVAGLVQRVGADEGDRVGKGQTLAELDTGLGRIDLDTAAAGTREAQAALTEAQRRLTAAREVGPGFFPADEIRSRESAVQVAQALVARRQSEQARLAETLERHNIRAPFRGVVGRRLVQVGEWVAPGTPLLELVDLDSLRLQFAVPQELYGRVGPRAVMEVVLDRDPGQRHAARVQAVIPVTDPSARTFTVRAELENRALALAPGMSARATLRLPSSQEGVLVPRDALNRREDGSFTVWVLADAAGAVREQVVKPGPAQGEQMVITEGLQGSERVVVRGNEGLRAGQRVVVQP